MLDLKEKIFGQYGKDLLSQTGIALFFMGNKIITDPKSGKQTIVLADGMDEEFQIAHELGLKLIPIGVKWIQGKRINQITTIDFDKYYQIPHQNFEKLLKN